MKQKIEHEIDMVLTQMENARRITDYSAYERLVKSLDMLIRIKERVQ